MSWQNKMVICMYRMAVADRYHRHIECVPKLKSRVNRRQINHLQVPQWHTKMTCWKQQGVCSEIKKKNQLNHEDTQVLNSKQQGRDITGTSAVSSSSTAYLCCSRRVCPSHCHLCQQSSCFLRWRWWHGAACCFLAGTGDSPQSRPGSKFTCVANCSESESEFICPCKVLQENLACSAQIKHRINDYR